MERFGHLITIHNRDLSSALTQRPSCGFRADTPIVFPVHHTLASEIRVGLAISFTGRVFITQSLLKLRLALFHASPGIAAAYCSSPFVALQQLHKRSSTT